MNEMMPFGDTSADTYGRGMRRRGCVDIPREGCFFISHRWHESLRISLSTDCTDDTDFMHRSRLHGHPVESARRSRQLRAQPCSLCVLHLYVRRNVSVKFVSFVGNKELRDGRKKQFYPCNPLIVFDNSYIIANVKSITKNCYFYIFYSFVGIY